VWKAGQYSIEIFRGYKGNIGYCPEAGYLFFAKCDAAVDDPVRWGVLRQKNVKDGEDICQSMNLRYHLGGDCLHSVKPDKIKCLTYKG